MQGSLEFPNNQPFYPVTCKVANGHFLPFIKKVEATSVTVSCNNPLGQNIITCHHPYYKDFVEEVDGLAFNAVIKPAIEILPPYIPILDLASSEIECVPHTLPVVALTLSDLISGGVREIAGSYHEIKAIDMRDGILSRKAFKGKNTILFLTGTDTLIESVWHKRDSLRLFERIRNIGFDAAGGFNFSVMDGECAFSQSLNQKRSLYSAVLIENAKTPAIPHVYALTSFHVNRWVDWFERNPSVKFFTVNCQLQDSDADIDQLSGVVKLLLRRIPYLHVILQGYHITKLYEFGSLIERIHIAEKTPIKYAHMRREILIDPSSGNLTLKDCSTKPKHELIRANIQNRQMFFETLRNKILNRIYQKRKW
jgi:hypothetical protein